MSKEEATTASTSSEPRVGERRRRRKRRVVSPSIAVAKQVPAKVAISPRPRRRRSTQTHKRSNGSSRKVLFLIVSMVIIGGFLVTLTYSYSVAYHNSDTYKKGLEAASSKNTGADTHIKRLEVGPGKCSAASLSLQWDSKPQMLRSIELKDLRSEHFFGSLLSFGWQPSQVSAEKGRLRLDTEMLDTSDVYSSVGASMERLHCKSLDVYDSADESVWAKAITATLHTDSYEKRLLLSGGEFQKGFFEGYQVKQAQIGLSQDKFRISARFEGGTSLGAMSLKGGGDSGELVFDMSLESVPSVRVLGDVLGKHLAGEVSSKGGKLEFLGSKHRNMRVSATSESLQLRGFECFEVLSSVLERHSYLRPVCSTEASFRLVKEGGRYRIDDLDAEERDFLKVRGSLMLSESGELSGTLKIGLPLSLRKSLEEAFATHAFTRESHGYLWESVEVRSVAGELRDDLRSKLKSNAETLLTEPEMTPDRLFDQLISQ